MVLSAQRAASAPPMGSHAEQAQSLRDEIERTLWQRILPAWYPRCLDRERGGFLESFSETWEPGPCPSKFLVYQARMTWVPAAVAVAGERQRSEFQRYCTHGFRFLADRMWDQRQGGFFDRTDPEGRPDLESMPWKQLYSYAFGIYAAATTFRANSDHDALQLAQDAFDWIDHHAHDSEHGGYFEHLRRDGRPVAMQPPAQPLGQDLPAIGRVGYKSMNAHIHMLEALIALGKVWSAPRLIRRLNEVFEIVRDRIVMPGGHLNMFATRDFSPRDQRSSFGHELEIAYLLVEAAELLHRDDNPQTEQTARTLVDHSLRWGWDPQHGGFYDEGPPEGEATKTHKVWWVQPEGLNGLLTVARLFGDADPRYWDTFARTWRFFRQHLVDEQHGGCFDTVAADGCPLDGRRRKASPWKTAYHVTRALLNAGSSGRAATSRSE